ncbi:unnamed protein product [Rotaria socialis]|uniref:Protein kinase domain-containing protein n=1 Tax=Rotaria socialis TaxID=392032 RepID=A0A820ZEZ1_9BILA|nr:unnamed protein product [Rotaria socialis]CAF4556363.1 unnamed protein product [Rotaria socialis]
MSAELTSLLGDEWYAVYASMTSHVNTVGLFSPISYFRYNLRGESLSRSTIELVWQPPSKPNEPITTYLVYYAPIDDRLPVNNSKLLCLMKDRWRSEESVSMDNLNLNNQSTRCSRPKNRLTDTITNNDDETDEEIEQNTDPLFIRSELKDTIINDLDHYFEDKSSTFNDQYKSNSEEQPVVEHKPYINEYNRSISDTRVLIEVDVPLLPRTTYRLRIITYTIARLNNEYEDREKINDDSHSFNTANLFVELVFTTKDFPNNELTRQNRLILFILIIGSIILLLIIIIGAQFYYYKYSRGDNKASISKNPNYGLINTSDQWEIDQDSVTIDKLIGQGHFGQIYQGVLKLPDGTLKPCAIKLRTTHPTDLLQEASIMKLVKINLFLIIYLLFSRQFQCHHVIQLYGICSPICSPYVVMELMENGDLKNYLYRHRQGEINSNGARLLESAMIQLALDIADGMSFDVLLWEIATLGEQPYQGYGNEEVVHYVLYGNITLERAQNCPEILHKLILPYENEDFRLHAYYHTQPSLSQPKVSIDNTRNDEEDLLLGDDDDSGHHFKKSKMNL